MKFALTSEEYQYIRSTVVLPLIEIGAQVWCFGSRARGDYSQYSDLDLMVTGGDDAISSVLAGISEKLVNGNFPYKVDLVAHKDLAAAYMKSVDTDKVIF